MLHCIEQRSGRVTSQSSCVYITPCLSTPLVRLITTFACITLPECFCMGVQHSCPNLLLLLQSSVPCSVFSIKLESCFVVQVFVPVSYHCSTAAKCSLAFQRLQGMKNAPCGPAPSIVYRKFWFLLGYQLDKNWWAVLASGPVCGGQWLKSVLLFLYHSGGISVALFDIS